MRSTPGTSAVRVGVLIAVGALAFIAGWFIAVRGPVVTPDSAGYLSAAANFRAGKGVTTSVARETERMSPRAQAAAGDRIPLTEWPPLYPVALGTFEFLGFGSGLAAAFVNTLGVALLAGIVFAATRLLTRSDLVAGVVTFLCVIGPSGTHAFGGGGPLAQSPVVLSEGLFVPLFAAATVFAALFVSRRTRRMLVFGIACSVAATLTRFVGAVPAFACAGAAFVVVRGCKGRERSNRSVVLLGASGVVAIGGFFVTTRLFYGRTPKVLTWHPPPNQFRDAVTTMASWFGVPSGASRGLAVAVVTLLVVVPLVLEFGILRGATPSEQQIVRACIAATIVAYVAAIVAAQDVLDAIIPMDQRLLAPIQPLVYLLIAGQLVELLPRQSTVGIRRGMATAGIALVLVLCVATPSNYADAYKNAGLKADAQRHARRVDASNAVVKPIFSNLPSSLYLFDGLDSYVTPFSTILTTSKRNTGYRRDVAEISRLVGTSGMVVAFPSFPITVIDTSLYVRSGLEILVRCRDGTQALGRPTDRIRKAATSICR